MSGSPLLPLISSSFSPPIGQESGPQPVAVISMWTLDSQLCVFSADCAWSRLGLNVMVIEPI